MSATVLASSGHDSIAEAILAHLPWRDVLSASAHLNRVVGASAHLQLPLRKAFYGIESVPDLPGAPGAAIERMVDVQRRWAHLQPKRIDIVPTEEMHGAQWVISNGFLVLPTHSINAPPEIVFNSDSGASEPIGDECTVYDLRGLRDAASLKDAPRWTLAFGFEYDSIAVNAADEVLAVCSLEMQPGGGPEEEEDEDEDDEGSDEGDGGFTVTRRVHFFRLAPPPSGTEPEPHPAAPGPVERSRWIEVMDEDEDEEARIHGRWAIQLRSGGVLCATEGLNAGVHLIDWKTGADLIDAQVNMMHVDSADFVPQPSGVLAVSSLDARRLGADFRGMHNIGVVGLVADPRETHHGNGGSDEPIGLNPGFRTDALFWTDGGGVREDGPVCLPIVNREYTAPPLPPGVVVDEYDNEDPKRDHFLSLLSVAADDEGRLLGINATSRRQSLVAVLRADKLCAAFAQSVASRSTAEGADGRRYTDHAEVPLAAATVDWDFRSFSRSLTAVAGLRGLQMEEFMRQRVDDRKDETRSVLRTAAYGHNVGADVVHERPLGTVGVADRGGGVADRGGALAATPQRAQLAGKAVALGDPWDDAHVAGEEISTPLLGDVDKPVVEVAREVRKAVKVPKGRVEAEDGDGDGDGGGDKDDDDDMHDDADDIDDGDDDEDPPYNPLPSKAPQDYTTTRAVSRPGTAAELLLNDGMGDVHALRVDAEHAYLLTVSWEGSPRVVVLSF
ncbi:hypothetical protein Q8F55_002629 [Vanrija albida]|uniref:F-box domain-containing protein n=1 Tax=Vanrija albida TaxID=181172 RepID=A0ABR3QAD4_9TREE